jgi:hypothetical protein
MPYIKISDPNTIDLSSWQQVVNVVNQHSDSINSITNNFGVQNTNTPNWNGGSSTPDFSYEYEPSSQKIIYGRTKIDTTTADSTAGDHMFYQNISFAGGGAASFAGKPIITATARFGNEEETSTTNANVVVTVIDVTPASFFVRLVNARSVSNGTIVPLTNFFYINWIAIGPK